MLGSGPYCNTFYFAHLDLGRQTHATPKAHGVGFGPMSSPSTPTPPDEPAETRPARPDSVRVDRRKLLLGGTAAAGLVWVAPVVLQTTGATASGSPNSCPRCGTNVLANPSAENGTGATTVTSWTASGNARRTQYGPTAAQTTAPTGGGTWYFDNGNGNNTSSFLSDVITLTTCEQTLVAAGKLSVSMTGLLISGSDLTKTATLTLRANGVDRTPILTQQNIAQLSAATLRPQVSVLLPVGTTTVQFRLDFNGKTPVADLLQANFVCT